MNRRKLKIALVLVLLLGTTAVSLAQYQRWRRGRRRVEWDAQGTLLDRGGVEEWENEGQFPKDVFTFVRLKYDSGYGYGSMKWATDAPDAEMNFSFRLQQLTSIKVNPWPITLEITDERIFDYPFLYMIEPGDISITNVEAAALRKYLLNGGFLMVDDFWGEDEWRPFERAMRQVFPDRHWIDVPLDHEIFQCVYQLKERPQIPAINYAFGGRSYETWDSQEVHYRAYLNDEGRIMVFICHNTDLGDGWEREGVDEWYFREYSEKRAYPLGINIVTYAMTH